ncbi:hypothetical protein [Cyanobium sp. ATX-6F1]|uniref:hypothetical protein n=1 Tax=Cyanobium sp. ATX-6F1 TaxID=3137388 RepID=UPI0039BE920E
MSRLLPAKESVWQRSWQPPPYVECDKTDDGRAVCTAAKIRAFPTWELAGKPRLEGVQTIEELKVWSGYQSGGDHSQH